MRSSAATLTRVRLGAFCACPRKGTEVLLEEGRGLASNSEDLYLLF